MTDTIFALSSGPPPSGVAVVRISGPHVRFVCDLMLSAPLTPRVATLRTLRAPGEVLPIDRALALLFPGPSSFTGEDVLELHLHGGPAVVAKVLRVLSSVPGLRPAQAGEFTRRAFLNQKLDLTEAEGLADVIEAQTEAQRRQSIAQSEGALSRRVGAWRAELLDISAALAALLDFADEGDVGVDVAAGMAERCGRLSEEFRVVLEDGRRGEIIRNGLTVVLAGPPNAGKSSLLNALAKRDVAIVSPYAGTTRDLIEVTLDLEGMAVVVVDTAGVREAADPVEWMGIERTLARARHADLVLWLSEDGTPPPDAFRDSIRIRTKSDLKARPSGLIDVSVESARGLDQLLGYLSERIQTIAPGEPALVTQMRQRSELQRAADALERVSARAPMELIAEEIRVAVAALDTLVGRLDVEDVLGAIFARFCIGK
jgi:tRNA modification GTPase